MSSIPRLLAALAFPLLTLAGCLDDADPREVPVDVFLDPWADMPPVPESAAQVDIAGLDACPAAPEIHAPIQIHGDEAFAAHANGIVAGAGTPDQPYVICGWEIVPVGGHGIDLRDTTAHVVIAQNRIHDAVFELKTYLDLGVATEDRRLQGGIHLLNVANVRVIDNVIVNNHPYVQLYPPTIPSGSLTPGIDGFTIERSNNLTIARNVVTDNSGMGLRLRLSHDVVVAENVFERNHLYGAGLYDAVNVWIHANTFVDHGSVTSLSIRNSPDVLVTRNTLNNPESRFAISISDGSHRAEILGNRIDNTEQALRVRLSVGVHVHGNDVGPNAAIGLGTEESAVDARFNWWGCPLGPDEDHCSSVQGSALVAPWAESALGFARTR